MPELPEVETIRRSLERDIVGKRIARVRILESRLRKPISPLLPAQLRGRRILGITRRGKYLLIKLDRRRVWTLHLGMTGKLLLADHRRPRVPHDHVVVDLSDGLRLYYHDPRRFGLMAVGRAELRGQGVEPLSSAFTPQYLVSRAAMTRRKIKTLLMDQKVLAGVGNIYANEILFCAGVRPSAVSCRLSRSAVARIVTATRLVLRQAIRYQGSSISDYRDGRGRRGRFQERFRVYGREGQPCEHCHTPIRRAVTDNRSSFFCRRCQK